MRGRFGLVPADCTTTRGDGKGLLTVGADSLRFYESVAALEAVAERGPYWLKARFAYSGEGMDWKKYQVLELQAGKLVRTESDPMKSYTYARCTS